MKAFIKSVLSCALLSLSLPVLAGVEITEGDDAKALYDAHSADELIISQKDKKFLLKKDGAFEPIRKLKVKQGQRFFIINEEEKYVHNVYDTTNHNWILKKQKPGEVAAIVVDKPGKHQLRCAIHPKMKLRIIVE